MVDQCRYSGVGIYGHEFWSSLLARVEVQEDGVERRVELQQYYGHFKTVGRRAMGKERVALCGLIGEKTADSQLGGLVRCFIVEVLLQQIQIHSVLLLILDGNRLQACAQVGDGPSGLVVWSLASIHGESNECAERRGTCALENAGRQVWKKKISRRSKGNSREIRWIAARDTNGCERKRLGEEKAR